MAAEVCPVCGLDYGSIKPLDAIAAIRSFPRRYRASLTTFGQDEDADALARRRPGPDEWSALEHAAYAADMIDRYAPAVRRMLVEDNPTLPFFGPEARVEEERWNESPVGRVVSDMETACADMASALDAVGADDWTRRGRFDWGERDILAAAREAVHQGSHHLRDIEQVLRRVRGR
ncbi:MAG TPA: DinB family protein [Acidimicrobiales bacterium]|nr:DinB family protein [Acidimicrobiales bacterium]